jgi:hypothetical protein
MKTNRLNILLVTLTLIVGLIVVAIVHRISFASGSADEFFRLRDAVYRKLQERTAAPMEGVTFVLPPNKESRNRIAIPFPNKAHIQDVVRRQDWLGDNNFQLLLDLSDDALPKDKQGNSKTMLAMLMLNHYFGELEKLGLHSRGTGFVGGKVQSATSEWFTDPDQSISVVGTVFVSPDSKQAIVIGRVREWLAKQ